VRRLIASASLLALAFAASAQTPRLRVDLGCTPTELALTYLCTVAVADSAGSPVEGVQVTLSADMPSMPMAHNVSPVRAQPVPGRPGNYQGRLTLEMPGEWVVRLHFEAPHRDVVVRKFDFQKDKVSPAGAR
jgi:YtkA-like